MIGRIPIFDFQQECEIFPFLSRAWRQIVINTRFLHIRNIFDDCVEIDLLGDEAHKRLWISCFNCLDGFVATCCENKAELPMMEKFLEIILHKFVNSNLKFSLYNRF